jgi:N-acetyl-alpha-D-muramate 1-phosphate uridylyltransferase
VQAVILAGGLGTRLLPRTRTVPKSLIEVAGRPFIAWQLERLAAAGFAEVVLCVGHLAGPIRAFVADGSAFGLSARCVEDGPHALGTAGALRNALPLLADTFLVTYGDSYLPFDYAAPLRDLQSHPTALGTLSVYENRGEWDESNTQIDGDLVLRYQKGASDRALSYIDYGAMALQKSAIARLPATTPLGLDRVQTELAREGKLRAYVAAERFYEIGSESGLAALEQHLAARAGG